MCLFPSLAVTITTTGGFSAENPPVGVMVTANEGKRHMSYAKSMGVHAYLNKPVPLETLIQTIYDLLKEGNRPASE